MSVAQLQTDTLKQAQCQTSRKQQMDKFSIFLPALVLSQSS